MPLTIVRTFDQLTIAQALEVAARFQLGEPDFYTYSFDAAGRLLCRQYIPADSSRHLLALAGLAEEAR